MPKDEPTENFRAYSDVHFSAGSIINATFDICTTTYVQVKKKTKSWAQRNHCGKLIKNLLSSISTNNKESAPSVSFHNHSTLVRRVSCIEMMHSILLTWNKIFKFFYYYLLMYNLLPNGGIKKINKNICDCVLHLNLVCMWRGNWCFCATALTQHLTVRCKDMLHSYRQS